jgi:predicted metal-dependent HD superfamily phosphohydrolase
MGSYPLSSDTRDFWTAVEYSVPRSATNDLYRELFRHYGDGNGSNGRYYHSIQHIEQCLKQFKQVWHLAEHEGAVVAALWLHDVIYDTHAKDNEEKSAEFAEKALNKLRVGRRFTPLVARLILATKHDRILTDPDEQLVADIDLSGFGQDYAVVEANSLKIRQEYSWVPKETYVAARKKVLTSFLDREDIYFTRHFQMKYEGVARNNLKREIENLGALA